MGMNSRRPDFFIVGAPKCGTTAMNGNLQINLEAMGLNAIDSIFPPSNGYWRKI
jgi:hypothetical protein